MRPTRRGRRRGRAGRADARRPIPDPFEHGEFAYAQTSPWPHFDQKLSLSTAMITRSRASYVGALDPSCPVKSEEPAKSLGVEAVVLRLQNVYGPGQSLANPYTG